MNAQPPPPPPPRPPYGGQYGPPQPPQPAQPPLQPPPGFKPDSRDLRPRRFWYWLAGLLLAGSIAFAVVMFMNAGDDVGSLTDVFTDLTEFSAPGETTAEFEAGDDVAIYRQIGTVFGPTTGGQEGLRCEVTDPGGAPVTLSRSRGVSTLDLNTTRYITEFTFDATATGGYNVSCLTRRAVPARLLIGPEVGFDEAFKIFGAVGGIIGGVFALIIGVFGAIAIVIPVAVMRSSHKRKLGREAAAAGL